jgi:hypothetical protein
MKLSARVVMISVIIMIIRTAELLVPGLGSAAGVLAISTVG